VANEEAKYSDVYFMLAKVGDRIVGFSEVGLREDNGAEIKMGGIDIAVSGEIMGVGTKLMEINGLIFQEMANERGEIDDVEGDENSAYIQEKLDSVNADVEINAETKKKLLGQMMMNRQKWLKFFGDGGVFGYRKTEEGYIKRYSRGVDLPRLNCETEIAKTDLRVELGIERSAKKLEEYESIRYFEADERFAKSDFDVWPKGKMDKDDLKERVVSLMDRGFQEYLPQIVLTRTEFQSDAKFLTVQNKNEKDEAEKVLREIEETIGNKWQMEVIVETYGQNQKKMRMFCREKYGKNSLGEIAELVKTKIKSERFSEAVEKDDYINGVYTYLKRGDIDRARAEFKGQYDKFVNYPELDVFLSLSMFDDDILSPNMEQLRWKKAMMEDN